ncbi:MAG: uroporphyrinogen decarboxylase family protein [Chloroflexota bacterium]
MARQAMTRVERLQAAIAHEPVDRLPVAVWRHFPVDDQDPEALAESVLAFQRLFDLDLIKVTPASSSSVRDWGVEDAWKGDPEGTRDYTRRVITKPEDWHALAPLGARSGELAAHLECLRQVCQAAGGDVPVLATVFSPLAQAKHLASDERLSEHLQAAPEAVLTGLETITRRTINFVEAARECGIAGVFYAIQHATHRWFDRAGYARFGEAFDRRILEAAQGCWLNILHLHGEALLFDLTRDYPVQVVNWHALEAGPGLAEGLGIARGAVCGGVRRWETLVLGTPASVEAEVRAAVEATAGRGLIVGAGCVVPVLAPRANLKALRESVDCA